MTATNVVSQPVVPDTPSVESSVAKMPLGRLIRAYLLEIKYETLRMLRMPAFAIPLLVLPIVLYVSIGVFAKGTPEDAKKIYSAFAVYAVLGPALFNFGVALAIERDLGVLKMKRALPMPAGAYLSAKLCMAMLFGAIMAAFMLPVGLLLAHVQMSFSQAFWSTVCLILGCVPFSAIGFFICTVANGKVATAVVNLVYYPMMFLVFIPPDKVATSIKALFPTWHLLVLMAASTGLPVQHVWVSLLALVGWTVVLGAISLHRFVRLG